MTFRENEVPTFMATVFEPSKAVIRAFPGCRHMELLRHTAGANTLFTFSIWDDEAALDAYRNSDFFQKTWAKTRALLAEKAEAWSLEVLDFQETMP